MKAFGILLLIFLGIGTNLICLVFSSKGGMLARHSDATVMTMKSSKLKDNRNGGGTTGNINLEDYRPIDPVPSSKAKVRPRPIEHGTPLMPYIPKPAPPPGRPKHGGSP